VRWKLPAGKSWYSAATLAGSHLVAACGDASQVIGANLDGTIVWRVPMSQAVVAQPASGPGFVVALLAPDTVGCIDFNGSIRWRHKLPASANEQPPVVVHGMILCSHSGGVTCLDRNGEPRWTNSGPPTHDSSTATATFTRPAWGWLDGQIRLVVGGSDGTVRCLSTSGLELWRTVFAGAMRAPLTVARLSPDEEPRVLARGDDGTLSCLSLTDGRVLWRVAGGTALTFAAPVVAYLPKGSDARGPLEARILWTDYEGMVRCVSAEGKLLWKWMAPGKLKGAPAVVRSGERADIIVADGEGCVTCLSPAGGERWRLIVPGVEEVLETPLVLQQPGTGPRLVISPKHGPLFCLELPGGDKR
jgi:outer membrane protein assembly factor BamB